MNITKPTQEAIQALITQCYIDNARIDRMKSVLLADLAYNETAEIVHKYIAHYFSNKIGDDLSEKCLERYNISVVFGGIPVMDKKYNTVKEVLDELLELVIDFQNQLSMCMKIASDNMDKQIESDLIQFNVYYNNIVDQCILLVDKIDLYKEDPSFDAHIKDHFFILKDVE